MSTTYTVPDWLPHRIVSGGQSGVDRTALDWAINNGIDHGGWCPAGRRSEDRPIPAQYRLTETKSSDYPERTSLNVADSDATLVLNCGALDGGTAKTVAIAHKIGKPHLEDASGHGDDAERWEPVSKAFRLHNGDYVQVLDDVTLLVVRTGTRLRVAHPAPPLQALGSVAAPLAHRLADR